MDKTCWFCSDFSACWCGKSHIEVDCFVVGDAHIGMLGAWAPDSARGTDNPHLGPMDGGPNPVGGHLGPLMRTLTR